MQGSKKLIYWLHISPLQCMGPKIYKFGYTFLHSNACVPKLNIFATHSSTGMHGSKIVNYWQHIPPFQCIVFFNAQTEKKHIPPHRVIVFYFFASLWLHIPPKLNFSGANLQWLHIPPLGQSLATHSSVRNFLGYTFLPSKIPPTEIFKCVTTCPQSFILTIIQLYIIECP